MSELHGFDSLPRATICQGVIGFPGSWALRVFQINAANVPTLGLRELREAIATLLCDLDQRLSEEYDYGKFGFVVAHSGRRGTCVTVTHFGSWGTTFEVFSSVWYQYGHGVEMLAPLGDVEPAFCWFEVELSYAEIRHVCEVARTRDLAGVRDEYLGGPSTWRTQ